MNVRIVHLKTRSSDGDFLQEDEKNFQYFFWKTVSRKRITSNKPTIASRFLSLYEEVKERDEEVLVITLSSGLSGTVNAANLAKQMCDYEKIWVVDPEQAIITQRYLVQKAVEMAKSEKDIESIVEVIDDLKRRVRVCRVLDTLTYKKRRTYSWSTCNYREYFTY